MSIASEQQRCPKCGGPIPPEAPQGLCPKCLLAEVSIPTEAGQTSKAVPPSRDELAAAFPHLEILELVGQGGMGFVFKARQPKLDRFVALKILSQSLAADPAFAERFTREGRVLARLSHPNIVAIHDFGLASGFFYLLMEFVDGVNLRQAMRAGRFTPDQALAIVPKICEALQYAHNEGILHRDIKPENILIDIKGRVKIADFGIAKLVGDVQPEAHLTGSGATLGTPHYMAPEQIEKPASVDHRADIYSLGVVFYEMLTGELPLGRFAPPSERTSIDPRVDDVVMRTLEKQREKRFQSAGEMKTTVEHLTEGMRSESTVRAGFAWSRKAIWGAGLVGVSGPLMLLLFIALQHVSYRPEINLVLMFLFLVSAAGITGTVLGWAARHEIRRRPRQWRGDELATFAAFTYPALLLCWIAFVILRNGVLHAVGVDLYPPMSARVFLVLAAGTIAFAVWAAFSVTRQRVNTAASSLRGALKWVFVGMAGAFGCLVLMSLSRLAHQRPTEEGPPASEMAAAIIPEVSTHQASAELWSPSLAPGEKPDVQKILNEAHEFAGQLRYEEALQRLLWYHNHALEYAPSQAGVRLSFALSYWMELARRYPKAKQALIEIRDRGTREFASGGGYFALFMEVSAINRELGEQDATIALFKSIQLQDPKLARQCYPTVEELLMEKGEYALCASFIPNFQARFENISAIRDRMSEVADRSPEINQSALRKQAQQAFIKDTRKLIEILVGVGRNAEAEKIREEAVAVLNVPELQSAVTDADQRVARFSAAVAPATMELATAVVPTSNTMRSLATRICEGDQLALDELRAIATQLYAGINYTNDPGRVATNLFLMRAVFDVLGEQAGRSNAHAFSALQSSVFQRNLKGAATRALGIAAAAGHEPSMDMLIHYRDWNILLSSTVFALQDAAEKDNDRAIQFLSEVVTNKSQRALWHGASQALRPAAARGNAVAKAALEIHDRENPNPK